MNQGVRRYWFQWNHQIFKSKDKERICVFYLLQLTTIFHRKGQVIYSAVYILRCRGHRLRICWCKTFSRGYNILYNGRELVFKKNRKPKQELDAMSSSMQPTEKRHRTEKRILYYIQGLINYWLLSSLLLLLHQLIQCYWILHHRQILIRMQLSVQFVLP